MSTLKVCICRLFLHTSVPTGVPNGPYFMLVSLTSFIRVDFLHFPENYFLR